MRRRSLPAALFAAALVVAQAYAEPTDIENADYIFASPDGWSSPEVSIALATLEGEWGFVSVEAAGSWFSQGLIDGAGACGAPKALNLDIREETLADGTRLLMLRKHREAEFGSVVTTLDVTGDDRARLTSTILDREEVYERNGDSLTVMSGGARIKFERCQ